MDLVPGRDCGKCTVCCTELHINQPELRKLAGVRCQNLRSDGGCAIYATRFKVCREFHCAWRVMPELSESWRPDRSGIVLIPKTKGHPLGYRADSGVEIMVLQRCALYNTELPGLIAAWVQGRVPLFLTIASPIGHMARSAFLNDMVEDAVRRQDRAALVKALEDMVDTLQRRTPETAVFEAVTA
ncbi:MAG: hypothetical protein JOZ72_10655 [Alphaproteobacteria bacterium]|nr:hypothetical protein [Alphaproteobacteria bacterium]